MVMIELIDEFYKQNGDNEKDYDGIHISSANKCIRQLYYDKIINKKQEIDPRIRRVFSNGNSFHRRMMKLLYLLPEIRVVASEVQIPTNPLVKGTCDAVVGIGSYNYVVDFKSINSSSFSYLNEPKIDHVVQILLYQYYLGIQRGIILYENKDNQELKEFEIESKNYENLLIEVFEKINEVKDCIAAKKLPEKPVFINRETWRCEYCNYKEECQQNKNVENGTLSQYK